MSLISLSFRRIPTVVLAGFLAATLGACGLVPKEPITQQPMTARPPLPPVNAQS
ncbi:flagellar basal body L-ring protein FlgH, partial [Caballeronia sp. M23-90]